MLRTSYSSAGRPGNMGQPRRSVPQNVSRSAARLASPVKAAIFDLSESAAYRNAFDDRFLLAEVAHPVVVNPDSRLARLARKKGWPICIFS